MKAASSACLAVMLLMMALTLGCRRKDEEKRSEIVKAQTNPPSAPITPELVKLPPKVIEPTGDPAKDKKPQPELVSTIRIGIDDISNKRFFGLTPQLVQRLTWLPNDRGLMALAGSGAPDYPTLIFT